MSRAAGNALDALADEVWQVARLGRKVVAVSGCRHGDGCTTLLLAIAQGLARRGLNVVMVDADFSNPVLARRLGLLPQSGWEEVLAGRTPLAEVVIESLEDRIAVLPLGEPPAGENHDLGPHPDPTDSLASLRDRYDVVLLDLGRFGRQRGSSAALPEPDGSWIDALVLIHNVRSTSPEDLAHTRQRIRAAGIPEAGIVENFV